MHRKNYTICLKFIWIILGVFLHFQSFSQLNFLHNYSRSEFVQAIEKDGDTLHFGFAGGLNHCQLQNIDINLDGKDDLLVFDRHGNRILPFITNSSSPSGFVFAPELADLFPPIQHWVQTIDYDRDGRKDIFTYTTGGILVYRNISVNELAFKQVSFPYLVSLQGHGYTNILVTYADYPAIADADQDGDYDIITFSGLGSFLEMHTNRSVELYGSSDSLIFEKTSDCYGHFAEGKEDNTIILDTCIGVKHWITDAASASSSDPKHTGSTLLLHDYNNDNLPDITIGDVDFQSLVHLQNGGSVSDAKMVSFTNDFPSAEKPIDLCVFPAAMLADINADGINDLLVSPFDPSLSKGENLHSVWLYTNAGTNANPDYVFTTDNFLQGEMLDFGSGAYPVLFDYNNDGLADILVGNYGYNDTCYFDPALGYKCDFVSQIALLLNKGTSVNPVFQLVDRDIAGLSNLQMQALVPALADLDGDGDMDLLCGNSKGKFVLCRNDAPLSEPADFHITDPAWLGMDVGDFSAPCLFDVDNNGLPDLLCGKRNGTISWYRNTGSTTMPQFVLETETFGNVDVTNVNLSNYGFSIPQMYRDAQQNTFLVTGGEFGEIMVFDSIDNNLNGTFRLLGNLNSSGNELRRGVAFGSINGDTLVDMLTGNYSGGIEIFEGKIGKPFGVQEFDNCAGHAIKIFPNPANDKIRVIAPSGTSQNARLLIHSMDGRAMLNFPYRAENSEYSVAPLPDGVYIIRISDAKTKLPAARLVICR